LQPFQKKTVVDGMAKNAADLLWPPIMLTTRRQIVTGSYHNMFRIFDRPSGHDIHLEASRDNISGPTHRLNPVTILQGMHCLAWLLARWAPS